MKYAWQTVTAILTLTCFVCCFEFIEYENKLKEQEFAYQSLLEDYKKLEEEKEAAETVNRKMILEEFQKIDEYIYWKEGLTALHKIAIPNITISDEDRQEFWQEYFICQDILDSETTFEE